MENKEGRKGGVEGVAGGGRRGGASGAAGKRKEGMSVRRG